MAKAATDSIEQDIIVAGDNYANAVFNEAVLIDQKAVIKSGLIESIMSAGPNPNTGKPHSQTSATEAAGVHPDLLAHEGKIREAARDRILAKAKYDAVYVSRLAYAKG
jgi:hypothetical protein